MPLSALIIYLPAKLKRETMRDGYLFDAFRALLLLKPGEYYPNFPSWHEILNQNLSRSSVGGRKLSFDEVVDGILSKL